MFEVELLGEDEAIEGKEEMIVVKRPLKDACSSEIDNIYVAQIIV